MLFDTLVLFIQRKFILFIMCSTHNPKKHYFATREKVCTRFTFVNEDSMCRSFMIDIAQFQQEGCLAIIKAILYLETKGFNVQKYQVTLPQFENMELDFLKNPLIPFQKLPKKQLFLHLQRKNNDQVSEQQSKKGKEPERYIGEVIEKVKLWRGLFDEKKTSLKEAAIIVGIPKKSLDDYFLLLRQGEIIGFQFDKNLNSKMGQLRSFIKKCSRKLPTGKLPLQMSKLKCYSLVGDFKENNADSKHTVFSFQEMKQNLKLHPMDLTDNCDYACDIGDDSD